MKHQVDLSLGVYQRGLDRAGVDRADLGRADLGRAGVGRATPTAPVEHQGTPA